MKCKLIPVLIAAAYGCAVQAGEAPLADPYFDPLPVVLSASRLVQPVGDAPAAVTVLDRETIRASGARQIQELFRLIPGFVVGYRSGHEPSVAYHGLADGYSRRLQVMIDGVSIYSPAWGGVDWRELPIGIDDIERIEVVRGPNGASFGANAFLGMINIITREPAGGETGAGVNQGGNGIADWHLRHSGAAGNVLYRVSAGQRADDGFDGISDNQRTIFANLRANMRLDAANEISATLATSNGGAQIDQNFLRPQAYENYHGNLRWTRAGEDGSEFWLQLHHAQRHLTEDQHYQTRMPGIPGILPAMTLPVDMAYKVELRRDEVEFQQTLPGAGGWRWLWGGQWRQDAVRSEGLFDHPNWLHNDLWRLFANAEYRPADWLLLHAGATYEQPALGDAGLSPRLAAIATLAPGHSLRLSVSRAQRNPTIYEESTRHGYAVPADLQAAVAAIPAHVRAALPEPYRTMIAQPIYRQFAYASGGLSSEEVVTSDIAYQLHLPERRLSGEVRYFHDRVTGLIYSYQINFPTFTGLTNSSWDFRNRDDATISGFEASVKWAPWRTGQIALAATRSRIRSADLDAYFSQTVPDRTASVLFRQELPAGLTASAAYYYVGPMRWLSGGDPLPSSERVDLRLARRFMAAGHTAEVAAVAQNLLDRHNMDFFDRLFTRRLAWLQLTLDY